MNAKTYSYSEEYVQSVLLLPDNEKWETLTSMSLHSDDRFRYGLFRTVLHSEPVSKNRHAPSSDIGRFLKGMISREDNPNGRSRLLGTYDDRYPETSNTITNLP
ncbi:MAG: hypothetical protein K1X53_09625 [Candidatus Sumerlaeaceae bacterium]|nr:hypothetical protein [Candidatus Sumerlaeaceae bacterium]